MSDQPVYLVDHDPSWQARFVAQRDVLVRLLSGWLAAPPEHVGSTAVPGLRAKPVIDIAAPVTSLDAAQAAVPLLEADGWLFWADDPNRSYRLWFLRPTPAARTHHLYLMQHEHPELRRVLRFRDALRSDAVLRGQYAELKQGLAERYRDDRDGYTDAKSDFIRAALGEASARRPLG